MKQSLQLKLSQQLTLTPLLQQSIKLLQLSTQELQTEVERFLLENPLLERADGSDAPEQPSPEEPSQTTELNEPQDTAASEHHSELLDWGHGSQTYRDDGEALDPMFNAPSPVSLRDHLLAQLGELTLPIRDRAIVQLLIEELDDEGYCQTDLEQLAAQLPAELEIESDELMVGLRLLQQFDPPGIATRSLAESLSLQLQHLAKPSAEQALALQIVTQHLDLLASRDYNKLKHLLGVDDNSLRAAQALISHLNPRPAASFHQGDTQYLIPDITVRKRKGHWVAELNHHAVPRLRVNQLYARVLSENRHSNTQMTSHLQEAKWLVKNIQQRFDTILKVAEAIVDRQQAFFEYGEVGMCSLVQREIAQQLDLHESTISRVTTQKYLLCPRGLFELKYFFGSALETLSGGECSATAIKARIRGLIDAEDHGKPLSDNALAAALAAQGISVARRTVAKYREAMQIPPASLRKSL